MGDRRLDFLRELERADEEVAATLAELDELYAASEMVRTRALELETFLVRLPAERKERTRALDAAEAERSAAEAAAERADAALEAAEADGDPDWLAAARRFAVRARDALAVGERRLSGAQIELEALERRAAEAEAETPALEARARGLAEALRRRPGLAGAAGSEPAPGLAGVADWGGSARAALLVARSALAGEREALIRQANELGSLVLGEPLTSASAATVARSVERALGD
jgi:hypothetical protein